MASSDNLGEGCQISVSSLNNFHDCDTDLLDVDQHKYEITITVNNNNYIIYHKQ